MDSAKAGFRLRTRPSDGLRSTRQVVDDQKAASSSSSLSSRGVPRSMARANHIEPRMASSASSKQSSAPSTTRRPWNPQKLLKPLPGRQPKTSTDSTTPSSSSSLYKARSKSDPSRSVQQNADPQRPLAGPDDADISCDDALDLRSAPSPSSKSKRSTPHFVDAFRTVQPDRELTASPQRIVEQPISPKQAVPRTVIYPELDRYQNYQPPSLQLNIPSSLNSLSPHAHDRSPPMLGPLPSSANSSQLSASSLSLSNKLFDTPALSSYSSYSRDTTPTSISSQSPGLSAPSRGLFVGKHRLQSPSLTRPPVTRRRTSSITNEVDLISADPHGLAAVKESSLSSSSPSNSSVQDSQQDLGVGMQPDMGHRNNKKTQGDDKRNSLSPQMKRGSQSLSKLESASTLKPLPRPPRASPRASPATSPNPARPIGRPIRDAASQEPQTQGLRSPASLIQGNSDSTLKTRNDRRSSESAVSGSVKSPSRVPQGKSASMDQIPLTKRDNARDSLTPNGSRSGTPATDGRSSSHTRFAFFGLGKRAASTSAPSDKTPMTGRKGPVAGTGHEGYTKARTLRRQSAGIKPAVTTTRIPSGGPIPPSDTFLADRMNPVIIAGGTVIENRNNGPEPPRSEVEQSARERPSIESKIERQAPVSVSVSSRRPSDGSDLGSKSSNSLKRTVQRLKASSSSVSASASASASETPPRLPRVRNKESVDLSRMNSCDASIMSDDSSVYEAPSGKSRRERLRKWNLFGRSRNKSVPEIQSEQVSVTVRPAEKKPMAFYTIMDNAEEDCDLMNVQMALAQAQVYTQAQLKLPPAPAQQSSEAGSSSRGSRLAQVGRIPAVVSTKPSTNDVKMPVAAARDADVDAGFYGVARSIAAAEDSTQAAGPAFNVSQYHHSPEPLTQEFLAFPPRKASEDTTWSSSTESCHYSFADAMSTAVIPKPDDPLAEDEIWDEYNDLLGGEHVKPRHLSTTSSMGVPFHLEAYAQAQGSTADMSSSSTAWPLGPETSALLNAFTTSASSLGGDDARTEQITVAFQPELDVPLASQPDISRQSGSSSSSEEWSPAAQVNLRLGSMTVSKWLTFSHVLFSDIRHELEPARETSSFEQPSILVIDGLGNDDWSLYAAESYPNATFFNLSPRPPPSPILPSQATDMDTEAGSGSALRPSNHRQIQYASHLDKFPFASHSFNCVVFRFPAAAPESHYHNVLLEARRVLKPEGFLEMSILDADLNTVGHRARKAIRQLKEQIHEHAPETNLASTADLIVRLLGKTGFSSIRAARVGVPVASRIPRAATATHEAGQRQKQKEVRKRKMKVGEQPSLEQMMTQDGPAADENITSMVARVGRWWYSRCYEDGVRAAGSGSGSVWDDKALLRECEEMGTSLKLMVCCARSPKRTKSI